MIDAAYLVAIALACFAIGYGSRSALVLVIGVLTTSTLIALEVPFHPLAWIALDLVLIAALFICCHPLGRAGIAIIVLFLPSWVLYFIEASWTSPATSLLVTAQLVLTLPLRRVAQRAKRTLAAPREWSNFDPMRFARKLYG